MKVSAATSIYKQIEYILVGNLQVSKFSWSWFVCAKKSFQTKKKDLLLLPLFSLLFLSLFQLIFFKWLSQEQPNLRITNWDFFWLQRDLCILLIFLQNKSQYGPGESVLHSEQPRFIVHLDSCVFFVFFPLLLTKFTKIRCQKISIQVSPEV